MTIPFEPTRSYVYQAARYELLPRIAEMVQDRGDEPFLLRELSKQGFKVDPIGWTGIGLT